MTATKEPIETRPFPEEGIYLHMPENVYHSIPAFSKSLVKKFNVSDIDAWECLYGDPISESPDMVYGSALHALILEGGAEFEKRYYKGFDKSEHADALDTMEDLKGWLKDHGLPVSGSKDVLIKRCVEADLSVSILELHKREYERLNSHKTFLPSDTYDEIVSREWIREQMFNTEGKSFSEVSFFWHDDKLGIPCKARLDNIYFGPERIEIKDLKSFTNTRQKPIRTFVAHEVGYRQYHIDGHFYTRALAKTPRVFHESAVKPDWPECTEDEIDFHLLFVEKGRPFPNVLPRELVLRQGSLTELGMAADATIFDAANRYKKLQQERGTKPWNLPHPHDYITESDIPMFLL